MRRVILISIIVASTLITSGCNSNSTEQPTLKVQNQTLVDTTSEKENSINLHKATEAMFIITNSNRSVFNEDEITNVFSGKVADEFVARYSNYKNMEPTEYSDATPITPNLNNFKLLDEHTCTIDYYETERFAYRYTLVFDDNNEKVIDYSFENILLVPTS